jgi:hypothetical protein
MRGPAAAIGPAMAFGWIAAHAIAGQQHERLVAAA